MPSAYQSPLYCKHVPQQFIHIHTMFHRTLHFRVELSLLSGRQEYSLRLAVCSHSLQAKCGRVRQDTSSFLNLSFFFFYIVGAFSWLWPQVVVITMPFLMIIMSMLYKYQGLFFSLSSSWSLFFHRPFEWIGEDSHIQLSIQIL